MKADRIKIYGASCSGKTSLALQLSEKLNIPAYHLDDFFWEENWVMIKDEEFRKEVEEIVIQNKWTIDGNYSRVKDLILPRSTLVIILNTSLLVIFWRLIIRSFARRGFIKKQVTKLPKNIKDDKKKLFLAIRAIFELGYHSFLFKCKRMKSIKNLCYEVVGKENVVILRKKKDWKNLIKEIVSK